MAVIVILDPLSS